MTRLKSISECFAALADPCRGPHKLHKLHDCMTPERREASYGD